MLNSLRNKVLKLPLLIIWLWLGIVFADAANLDDFILRGNVVHTDLPNADSLTSSEVYVIVQNRSNDFQQILSQSAKQTFKLTKYVYDEDSPSLAPAIRNSSEGICAALQLNECSHNSLNLSKPLYIEFCTLLI